MSEEELVELANKELKSRLRDAVVSAEIVVSNHIVFAEIVFADNLRSTRPLSKRLGPAERINFLEGFLASIEVVQEVF